VDNNQILKNSAIGSGLYTIGLSGGGGGATFTLVERVKASGSCESGLTATFGTPTTAGEAIFLAYHIGASNGTATITDSGSEAYTKSWEITNLGVHYTAGQAYKLTSASGISSVKVTNASDGICGLVVSHWKRSSGSWALDKSGPASSTGVSSPWSSPTVTTTAASELLVGANFARHTSGSSCAEAPSGSWAGTAVNDGNGNADFLMDQTVSSIQTNIAATGTTSTCTSTGANYPGIVTFK
jgi:hypothetical protein